MPRVITKNWLRLILIFFTAFGVTLIVTSAAKYALQGEAKSTENVAADEPDEKAENESVVSKPSFIDLRPTVDAWANAYGTKAAVEIYDLDNETIAATYNANEIFGLASIYKLFFVYDGYRQISSNAADANEIVAPYDVKGSLDYNTCLDLMVRESYNGCAEPIRADTAKAERASALIAELGLESVSGLGLYSNARDLTEFMKVLWQHDGFNEASWAQLLDSMLNQPKTTYNWRQGLPSGFSTALVYDKVGWDYNGSYWNIYDDTAFVVFPELDRHYIVTVLTSGLATYQPLVQLGSEIENAVLHAESLDTNARE